jgi:hypothetical protein
MISPGIGLGINKMLTGADPTAPASPEPLGVKLPKFYVENPKTAYVLDGVLDPSIFNVLNAGLQSIPLGFVPAYLVYRKIAMSPQTKARYIDHKHLDSPEDPGNLGVCTVEDSYRFDPVPLGLFAAEGARIQGAQATIGRAVSASTCSALAGIGGRSLPGMPICPCSSFGLSAMFRSYEQGA